MEYTRLEDINQYKGEGINPLKTPDKIFELYSVPEFDSGRPEVIKGRDIGSSKATVKKNDILLCKINPRINRVWVVGDYTEYQSIASSEWIVVRNNEYNPEYLAWYFRTPRFKKLMTSQVTGIGGSLTRAQPKQVKKYPVPVLNRNEQDEVVNVLNKADEIIAVKKKELEQLDILIKARFVELFGDPINNPMNWDTDSVEALCDNIYGGGTPSKSHPEYYENGNIPWVSSKDMKTDIIYDSQIHINQLGVDNSTAQMVPENSVIMVIRSGILKHTLPVAVNAVPVTVNQDLKVFIPSERLLTKFMAVQFKILEKDILSGVRAVTADNIEFNSLKRRKLIVPPIEKQRRYVNFISQVDKSKFDEAL